MGIVPVRIRPQRIYASLTVNLTGRVRLVTENGVGYLVAPVTMIVPGVLNGSKGALAYYPADIAISTPAWNGVMLTVNHPSDPLTGAHLSANDPGVWDRQGIGQVRNARVDGQGKLKAEGWFDIERTRRVDNRVLNALESGTPIELSTGLYTENYPARPGATYNGRPYDYVAQSYKPDHLAVLPDQVGACSRNDGCGVLVNSNPEGYNQYTKGGNKPLLVDDGSHRIQAAQLEGATHILTHVSAPGIRGLGDRSGTKTVKVSVEDLHPPSQLKNQDEATKASYDQKAIAKYRKQYRAKGETGWSALPLVQDPNLKKGSTLNAAPTVPKVSKLVKPTPAPKARSVEAAQSVADYKESLVTTKPVANDDEEGSGNEAEGSEGEDTPEGDDMAENVDLAALAHKWATLTVNQLTKNAGDPQSRHLESGQYLNKKGSSQTQVHSRVTKGYSGTTVDRLRPNGPPAPDADEPDDHTPEAIEEGADDMENGGAGGKTVDKGGTANREAGRSLRRFVVIENGVYERVGNAEAPQGAPVPSTAPTKGPTGLDVAPPLTSPPIEGRAPPPNNLPPASNTKEGCEDCGGMTGNSKGMCVQCGGKMTENLTAADEDSLVPQGTEPMSPRASMIDTDPTVHSNPEGHNQYTSGGGGSDSAKWATSAAHDATTQASSKDLGKDANLARRASERAREGKDKVMAHTDAARAHKAAAGSGDPRTAELHLKAAALHRQAAEANSRVSNTKRCPECSGRMTNGKCEECGYEDDETENGSTRPPTENAMSFPPQQQGSPTQPPAHAATTDAFGASARAGPIKPRGPAMGALQASHDDDPDQAANSHEQAAEGHEDAATDARKDGDFQGADQHDNAAALHRKAASMHYATTNAKTTNAEGTMTTTNTVDRPLTLEQRDKGINFIANALKLSDADKGALHALSDRAVLSQWKLTRNAKAEGSNADTIGDDDDEQAGGEEDQPADGVEGKGAKNTPGQSGVAIKKGTQVKNTRQAEHDWLAAAPTENMRTMFADALQHQHNERLTHVGRLTANVSNDQTKRQLTAELMQTPLPKLRLLAASVPAPRQTPTYQPAPVANYLGAAAPTGPTGNAGYDPASEEMVLPMPRMVWNTKDGVEEAG